MVRVSRISELLMMRQPFGSLFELQLLKPDIQYGILNEISVQRLLPVIHWLPANNEPVTRRQTADNEPVTHW